MKNFLSDKLYDWLKYICIIALPALGTLYAALAGVWGLPYEAEIPQTFLAVETFLGAILMISTAAYGGESGE